MTGVHLGPEQELRHMAWGGLPWGQPPRMDRDLHWLHRTTRAPERSRGVYTKGQPLTYR